MRCAVQHAAGRTGAPGRGAGPPGRRSARRGYGVRGQGLVRCLATWPLTNDYWAVGVPMKVFADRDLDQLIAEQRIKLEITDGVPTWRVLPSPRHQMRVDR